MVKLLPQGSVKLSALPSAVFFFGGSKPGPEGRKFLFEGGAGMFAVGQWRQRSCRDWLDLRKGSLPDGRDYRLVKRNA